MRQLLQNPKSGAIEIVELPPPALRPGFLLVRNACSVISPGTERSTVAQSRQPYLKTARERPDLVRRVLDGVRRDGVLATYRKVRAKLDEPRVLGYASAGTVIAVGEGAGQGFSIGDRVACAGHGHATHSEIVAVPVNLAARVPDDVPFETAAFATLGAIAMHGVRQAAPALGERVAVIGLGILGLLTVQLLRAAGARVAAFDLAAERVDLARGLGAESGLAGGTDDQVHAALAWSGGVGADAAIVTAASASDAPMVAAAGMCRDRGRVVAVGLVPFGLPREIAYAKELELRISRSYGPGRYDAAFEERGVDYPLGYVRWTETRNLETFLDLVRGGEVRVEPLVTHRLALDGAPAAYDALFAKEGPRPLGMVVRYPEEPAAGPPGPAAPRTSPPRTGAIAGLIGVGFVGAGAFARSVLLPRFAGTSGVRLRRVCTAHGATARDAQAKFGFDAIGTDADEILGDPGIDLVCIATRHADHADLVARALEAGKHVFVEKPLALDEAGLARIEAAARGGGLLVVGFNRRFAPMARAVRDALGPRGPIVATCRVNAGALPSGHWLNDPEVGGGRMIGEGCHFVDLLSFLAGDPGMVEVDARRIVPDSGVPEDFAVQIRFADGSLGQLLYTARGHAALGKERIEAHAGGASAVIDDWRDGRLVTAGGSKRLRTPGKGHAEEIAALLAAVRAGGPSPIPLDVLTRVTRATFRAAGRLGDSA